MRAGKLKEIGYELATLWKFLTRKELCDFYEISDRTLSNYKKELGLPKNTVEESNSKEPVRVWIQQTNNKFKQKIFKDWNTFAVWTKCQSNPITFDTINKAGQTYPVCRKDFSKKTNEAIAFEQSLEA